MHLPSRDDLAGLTMVLALVILLACVSAAHCAEPTTPVTAPQVGKVRVLEVPGLPIGNGHQVGGWHRAMSDAEYAAIAGEHVTAQDLAEIRRADNEHWWMLGVWSLAVLVGFIGIVAALYLKSAPFLFLPAAGIGVSFLAYFFIHAFVWLAWVFLGILGIMGGVAVWYVCRRGGILRNALDGAVAYGETLKAAAPPEAKAKAKTWAKKAHAPAVADEINAVRVRLHPQPKQASE